jgi:hypothetical protein
MLRVSTITISYPGLTGRYILMPAYSAATAVAFYNLLQTIRVGESSNNTNPIHTSTTRPNLNLHSLLFTLQVDTIVADSRQVTDLVDLHHRTLLDY